MIETAWIPLQDITLVQRRVRIARQIKEREARERYENGRKRLK